MIFGLLVDNRRIVSALHLFPGGACIFFTSLCPALVALQARRKFHRDALPCIELCFPIPGYVVQVLGLDKLCGGFARHLWNFDECAVRTGRRADAGGCWAGAGRWYVVLYTSSTCSDCFRGHLTVAVTISAAGEYDCFYWMERRLRAILSLVRRTDLFLA